MIDWFPEMIETLTLMRQRGAPFETCADAIGVATDTARAQARKLGLPSRVSARWTPDRVALLARLREQGATVRACAAQLGVPPTSVHRQITGERK